MTAEPMTHFLTELGAEIEVRADDRKDIVLLIDGSASELTPDEAMLLGMALMKAAEQKP